MSSICDPIVGTPDLPAVTLSALPTELKSRIVRHCFDQDEQLVLLLDSLKQQGIDETALDEIRREHPGTIRSLFEVSKEWSAYAAPYRFRVLKCSKAGDIIFRFDIALRRATLFHELVCDTVPSEGFDSVLTAIPQMINLRMITITHTFLGAAVSAGPLTLSTSVLSTRDVTILRLRDVLRRIPALELCLPKAGSSRRLELVRLAQRLRVLRLDYGGASPAADALGRLLATIPGVTELSLVTTNWRTNVTSVVPQPSLPFPRLRELSITAESIDPSVFGLISPFRSSLESLTLDISQPVNNPASVPDTAPFPVLTSLTLAGRDQAYTSLVDYFTPTRFPSLKHIRLDICTDFISRRLPLSPLLQAFLDATPRSLPKITVIRTGRLFTSSELWHLGRWSRRDGFELSTSDFRAPPSATVLDPFAWRADPSRAAVLAPGQFVCALQTAEFIQDWAASAYQKGDAVQLARIMTLIQRIELVRAVMSV
ncbi:hypothetical protein JCM10449v2_003361 [Rhodotorula kratochvilovae]